MRTWILLFLTLLLTGCYDKTTCCTVDGGCDADVEDDGDADGDTDGDAEGLKKARND